MQRYKWHYQRFRHFYLRDIQKPQSENHGVKCDQNLIFANKNVYLLIQDLKV